MRDKWFWFLELCSFGLILYVGYITGRNVEVRQTFDAREDYILLRDSIANLRPDPRDCEAGTIHLPVDGRTTLLRIHC